MSTIPQEFRGSAFNSHKWGGKQPEFYSFKKQAIIQISKNNAYKVALGTEVKMAVINEPVRAMQADGVTPVLSCEEYGQLHNHYQYQDKKIEKHNDNWEKHATIVFDVIQEMLELTLLPKVSRHIMERNPSACWTAFLALGGLRNAAIAVSARNGLGNTVFTNCSITVIAACIEETYERVNENLTDPVSDSEKKAMLVAKVTQMDDEGIFTFDIKSISLKVSAPIPGYDDVKSLLLTCESSHFQDMDPQTLVKATFNSFGMKGNNKELSSETASENSDCPLCHYPGHTSEDCFRFVDCQGCGKVHSKHWKGCPSRKFSEKKPTSTSPPSKTSTSSPSKKRSLANISQK
jgi:hypothetical protein